MEDSDSQLPVTAVAVAMDLPVTASLGPVGPLLRALHSRPPEDEIQRLTADLDGLCISLLNHSEAEEPSYRDKCWMREIRELCYDTKNYMDDAPFLLKQDEDAQEEELTPEEKQEIAALRFEALEDRVTDASKRSKSYTTVDPQNINRAKFLPVARRGLPVLHPELIDRARMDHLATLLRNEEEEEKQLKVVSLLGPEGVGKTTLAKRLLYHRRTTGGEFQCRAFVRVSPNTDMRRLLTSIFSQIQGQQPSCRLDAQDLLTSIFNSLRGQSYLIIIDDLWSTSVWDIIWHAFPDDGRGSRIITTTQIENVASTCSSYEPGYIFEMEPFKDDQSERLFFGMVFGSEHKSGCPKDFAEVANGIIRKCGGLPLLTINVAGLLPAPNEINSLQQWMDIRDSLPPTPRKNPSSEGMEQVLNFVYNNLSPELKTCLLYLAMYPEGYTVNKNELVKQWVVEGFAGEEPNKEETAHEYFDELVSRGMIQAVDINYRGVMSCTLHHVVHVLIVKKAMQENFIITVDYSKSPIGLLEKVRRLSVQFGGARSAPIPDNILVSEVQSLAFFGFYRCSRFVVKHKLLRVLTLHVWADQDETAYDLSGISKLLRLRYLKVVCNIAVKLPDQIQALQYLETLEIDATTVVAIPSDIALLGKLSSLKIALRKMSKLDIGILQALRALSDLSLHVWAKPVEMIFFDKGEFSVLKYFKFRCSVPWLKFEAGSMPILQNLNLCFNSHEADQRGIVPIGIEHLPGLKKITAEIWGADTDVGSAFRTAISNHPSNPRIDVQLVDGFFYGDDEKKQAADSSMSEDTSNEDSLLDSRPCTITVYGLTTILAAGERDYLVRNSGEQVKISSIEGGTVALYFSASWCLPCGRFTPKLIEAYKELASHGKSFEVVFVSGDRDEEAFNAYFAKMPWLAVPFSDSEGREGLDERFEVSGIPHLVILDAKTGEVLTGDGVEIVSEYGIEAYPFTPERISELKEQEKAAKDNQTIHSVLGTPDRDYLISNKGGKVPISDLEGKYVGLCFVVSGYGPIEEFTTVLAKIYGKLKEVGEKFEVIAVSLDSDEASFNESFSSMPWLAIPQGDKKCQKLVRYFELSDLPTLVLIGPDGKTLNINIADIIQEHGMDAWEGFPFNAEKLVILAEKAKAKAASQTLESLLVTGDLDFVIGKDGAKVPVSELAGKTVLLYFSAAWCGPCRAFLPTLVEVYNKIKEKNSDFEIVFVSSDRDQSSFDDFFSGMPWLALPLGDERKAYLSKMFKIRGIPSLVAIGPTGKTVNTDAKGPIAVHGADAFPFTEERIQELEKKIDEMAKVLPEKLMHELHEHELVLTRRPRPYVCDGCDKMGTSWSYNCAECDFDLHTSCALGEVKKGEEEKGQDAAEAAPAGYICEGDVCRKA